MKTITSQKLPIKIWTDFMEEGALNQAEHLANLPFAFKHIAIMPDTHQGFGMPIGGVLATKDVVIPNAVGVDIGCGMCAVKTSITEIDKDILKEIVGEIRKEIPVGFNHQKKAQDKYLMPNIDIEGLEIVSKEYGSALKQIGTLGGGNHFIEIQKGSDGHIWIMIHSGSRNLGKQVAEHYNHLAQELNGKYNVGTESEIAIPSNWQLACLPVYSKEGQAYLKEMKYCVEFAQSNRELMMSRIQSIFFKKVNEWKGFSLWSNVFPSEMINIAHNYASFENHFGEDVWVHRKGATLATKDTVGIIPGSQGSKSYIVKGLGNPDSFMSCSHGAGRKMSRTKAKEELNLEEEKRKLDEQGIIHGVRTIKDLDEASGAYKNIDEVMENQKDLVEILVELKTLAVIKG